MSQVLDEDWCILVSLLPDNWESLAAQSGAVTRLRGFDSSQALLRTLLLHVGVGYSLRETAVHAQAAGLAGVSDVTVLNRLRQAEAWWRALCQLLLAESGVVLPGGPAGRRLRVLDGTLVREPGRTGSQWRIHYSVRLPSLDCDHFVITPTRGRGTAEILHRFPAEAGDLVLADRAYCTPAGVELLRQQGADVLVRWNSGSLPLQTPTAEAFDLLGELRLMASDEIRHWPVMVQGRQGAVVGRVCAVRKSAMATERARKKIRRKAQQGGPEPKAETLEYAGYVIVFTTLSEAEVPAPQVLEWYRSRWQIELVFKRLKSIAHMGHLPKHSDQSARAWLYGKLLVSLLAQKLIRIGRSISPWGYELPAPQSQ